MVGDRSGTTCRQPVKKWGGTAAGGQSGRVWQQDSQATRWGAMTGDGDGMSSGQDWGYDRPTDGRDRRLTGHGGVTGGYDRISNGSGGLRRPAGRTRQPTGRDRRRTMGVGQAAHNRRAL